MAEASSWPTSQYFKLTHPLPFVAHVEINRPEKLNAFTEPMWLHLPALFSYLAASPSVRAIVLSGAGPKAFTAGLDVQAASTSGPLVQSGPSPSPSPSTPSPNPNAQQQPYSQPTGTPYTTQKPPPPSSDPPPDPARLARQMLTHITTFQHCISSLETCSKPIIAVLHGYCYGLGIDLSLCADVRIAVADTKFSVKEVDIGLAADVGTLSRLGKVTGNESWVKDICLSARPFSAAEALQHGFISRVVEGGKEGAMREAMEWAGMVAAKSPVAVQGTKELVNWSRGRSVADGLRYTAVWNSVMLQTDDVGRAMKAGMGKGRKARFEKL
ncbi:MAG: hypothetical protein L6R40_002027 [Gallowayella cf. fulva]|nr:MAG: hypothetical protein L6R40_002027 [Xanthomendoza cf. fulva]